MKCECELYGHCAACSRVAGGRRRMAAPPPQPPVLNHVHGRGCVEQQIDLWVCEDGHLRRGPGVGR